MSCSPLSVATWKPATVARNANVTSWFTRVIGVVDAPSRSGGAARSSATDGDADTLKCCNQSTECPPCAGGRVGRRLDSSAPRMSITRTRSEQAVRRDALRHHRGRCNPPRPSRSGSVDRPSVAGLTEDAGAKTAQRGVSLRVLGAPRFDGGSVFGRAMTSRRSGRRSRSAPAPIMLHPRGGAGSRGCPRNTNMGTHDCAGEMRAIRGVVARARQASGGAPSTAFCPPSTGSGRGRRCGSDPRTSCG